MKKKLFLCSFIGTSILFSFNPVKADWDYWGIKSTTDDDGSATAMELFTIDSTTGNATSRTKKCFDRQWYPHVELYVCGGWGSIKMNSSTGKIEVDADGGIHTYDIDTDTWQIKEKTVDNSGNTIKKDDSWKNSYHSTYEAPFTQNDETGLMKIGQGGKTILQENIDGSVQIGSDANDIDIVSDGLNIDGTAVITKNADGSVQIGSDANDIDLTSEGLNINGNPLITKKSNGEIHIGKNSLITTSEEVTLSDGTKVQPLYAKDANGNKIPINIDGSKLLIDGVEIIPSGTIPQVTANTSNISNNTSNIKNLGQGVAGSTALTAALTALPQTSKDSKLSCGVGSGAYSSRYAVGFGCASKVSERIDINAGGSYVFGGSKSYGQGILDSRVVKAGFVFKLGELNQTTEISMKEKKELKQEIKILKENNQNILAQNKVLLARLERLEKIALSQSKSQNLAVYKLK